MARRSVVRIIQVTLGLSVVGSVVGGILGAGLVALLGVRTGGFRVSSEELYYGAVLGGTMGSLLAPVAAWTLIRRVPTSPASARSRAAMSLARFAGFLGLTVLAAGCFFHRAVSTPFDGCGLDEATRGYIVRTAANAIIGDRGAGGPRIRSLASVPLVVDSIRARSQGVSDRAICEHLWYSLDPEDRESRVAAVQIGHTYWVRVPGGTQAFDDRGRRLTAIVDLDL